MKLRYCICGFVVLCLLFGLCLPVFAEGSNDGALEQAIIDACTYRRDADISSFYVLPEDLSALYDRLQTEGKLPWYVTEDFAYSYIEGGCATIFTPDVLYDGNLDMAAYEEAISQVLAICVLPGMSQAQIALSVHDYLIANSAYDETEEKNYSYDILVNRTAMCAGYAEAYQDLLQRAGVECLIVNSDKMEHAWNLVCIDGSWYHVDLTWDDPTPNYAGYVEHTYFLLTDEEISSLEEPHYDWDTNISCTDTRFADAFWKDVYGQICYESKDTSYLLRSDEFVNTIYRRDESTGTETPLYQETTHYINIGHGNYAYWHTGLTLRDGRLWFNSMNKLHSMNTDGTGLQTEYAHSGNTYLFSSHVFGTQINLTVMDHDGNGTDQILETAATDEHIHNFTRTVTDPSCTESGFTLSVCDCGLEATGTPTEALGHEYYVSESKNATLFSEGACTYLCAQCDHSFTESTPKIQILDFLKENSLLLLLGYLVIRFVIKAILKKKKQKYHSY